MVAFACRGAAGDLINSTEEVVLIEGPAGTGKSIAACWKFHIPASQQRLRILLARKTRKSLTDSIMVSYEAGPLSFYGLAGRHMIGKSRSNRDRYSYPNGTEVVLGGFDDPAKILSSEYDIIVVEQAEQCLVTDVEIALSRLRNNSGYEPKQLILVANPASKSHWLMSWARTGKARWLTSTIRDNPLYWDADRGCFTPDGEKYLRKLSRLSGVNRRRLVDGEWCGEEGQILTYDPRRHVIDAKLVQEAGSWWLAFEDGRRTRLDWFVVGVDWGNIGTMIVIGFDRDRRGYVVEQHYHAYRTEYEWKRTTEWWADLAEQVWRKYEPIAFVPDDAEPDRVAIFYERLGPLYGRDVETVVVKPNKSILTGIAELQEGFDNDELFILAGSLAHEPDTQIQEGQPTDLISEIDQWIWLVDKQSGLVVNKPDPRRADHAIDATRYAWMWARNRDHSERESYAPQPLRNRVKALRAG